MPNTLYTNDNLFVLYGLNSEIADLIYLDPPFNSKRMYSAPVGSKAAGASFKDMWTWQDINEQYLETLAEKYPELAKYIETVGNIHSKAMMAYILYMAQRLVEMHRILKPTGSIYLHCDPTASHYLKHLMDSVFGKENFRNEIVWCYRQGGRGKSHFARKHDIILFYARSANNIFYDDEVRIPYDGTGGYQTSGRGVTHKDSGRTYLPNPLGKVPEDWWDIPTIPPMSKERTGYPTQKPLELLHRIIKASSKEGDLVLDPFCGCATTCVASQQLGRKWIGIDIESKATEVLVERLSDDAGLFSDFICLTKAPQRTDVIMKEITPQTKHEIRSVLFKQQNGHCNGCNLEFNIENFEIDHIVPRAKGGGDFMENYQLLCPSCNRVKGARPMEYLRMKIEVRLGMMKNRVIFGE